MDLTSFLLSSLIPTAAEPRPDSIAVICDTEQITWAQLDDRVARLAGALVAEGVSGGDRVGIYLHKSVESVVAMHAILRAGAAYVPIDPLAAGETVASIVADCGIEILISHEPRRAGLSRLPAGSGHRLVIGLDDSLADTHPGLETISWSEVNDFDPVSPRSVLEDDLAYVMYTSGSTGSPKGMMHTHRSGMSYVRNTVAVYGLDHHDRTANFSPLHFDMSTFELLAGASVGATMVLVPEPHLRFPATLAELLERHACTTWQTVPSLFQQLLNRGLLADRDLTSVRWVVTGGEVFPPAALIELVGHFPNARFSNTYGPAEVNQCSYHHFSAADLTDGSIPIGRPVPNTELQVVDDDDNEVEPGEPGLLIARTANMMAGYWSRPDLNENAFLHREGPGGKLERWYRIGDVVTEDDAGLLWFHGRRDNQVKIRGNRLELEGVEAAVASLPGVEQAVVGIRKAADSDDVLVAHYLASTEVDTAGWRASLSAVLPPYGVPSVFEEVESFPRTPSGKVDRKTVREQIQQGAVAN